MKHLKHFILALVLMASALPAFATITIDSITYDVGGTGTSRLLTLIDGSQRHGAVTIPAATTIRNVRYRVVAIGDSAFMNNTKITSINIPAQVTKVGNHAFHGCTYLHTVDFQNTDSTTIGDFAFFHCYRLKAANLPDCVTSIGTYSFHSCGAMTSFHFPSALKEIPNASFFECNNLQKLDLPEGLLTIGPWAFYGCTALESVYTPKTLQEFSRYCFYGCSSLKELRIKSGVTTIGDYAFRECKALEKVFLIRKSSLPTVGSEPFDSITYANARLLTNWWSSVNNYTPWKQFSKKEDIIVRGSDYFDDSFKNLVGSTYFEEDYDEMVFTLKGLNKDVKGYMKLPPVSCKIVLEGENNLVCRYDSKENCYGLGIQFSPKEPTDSLIIEGPGSLKITTKDFTITKSNYWSEYWGAIDANGCLTIRNCTIEATGNYGITGSSSDNVHTSLTIDNATVKAKGNAFYDSGSDTFLRCPSISFFDQVNLIGCSLVSPEKVYLGETNKVYPTKYKNCTYYWSGEDYNIELYNGVVTIQPDAPETIKGDVNGDGKVDTSDLSELISIILNNGTATDYPRADVNGDSKVDTTDISALMSIILGA